MTDFITKPQLENMGFRQMPWNNGKVFEYYLSITGEGIGIKDSRLSVRFGEWKGIPYKVYLIVPGCMIVLHHVDTPQKLLQFYELMTGGRLEDE